MQLRRAVGVVLVVALVVGAAPAVAALAGYAVPVTNEIPVTTDQTPTVVLDSPGGYTDIDLQNMWAGTELDIRTDAGNITVSGDTGASAHIDVGDIEGTETTVTEIDAGTSWLNLNPADKQRVDIRRDATSLSFKSITVDDGTTDLTIGGPTDGTAEVRIYGLSANTQYGLYDPNRNEVLGTFQTDGSGVGQTNVSLPDGSQDLEVRSASTFSSPSLSNPDPTGQVTEMPDTLSVDVTGDAWPVTVEFYLEGSKVGEDTLTSDGTASTSVSPGDIGSYNWSAVSTDGVEQTDTINASFETPSSLTLHEEHDPQDIANNTTATLRFFTVNGDIAIERESTDGTLNLTGLPDTPFVVFVQSDDYYNRRVYIDSIFEQQEIYLLNETEYPRSNDSAIRSRFIYEDLTGQFPRDVTTIQIQRAIDQDDDGTAQWTTVTGDFWGASSEFEAILQYGIRYRIVLTNRNTGQTTISGTHFPTEDLSQTIRVSGLVAEAENASGVYSNAEYNASSQSIDVVYRDSAENTNELRVIVEERGGGQTLLNTTVGGPLGTYSNSISLNDSQADKNWIVTFEANGGDQHRSVIPVGSGTVGLPVNVPSWLLSLLLTMAMTFVGALYGPRTALLGAWAMVFVAAGVAMFGWAFSGTSVIVAALVATGMTLLARALP